MEQNLISVIRFIPTAPVTSKVGDVVEVQVSFAVLPLRYGKLKNFNDPTVYHTFGWKRDSGMSVRADSGIFTY